VRAKERLEVAWRLLRPFTLAASVVPVLTAMVAAVHTGHVRWGVAWAFLAAAILIQSATNMFNEYFDYRRGLDTEEMVGIAGTIVRDGVAPGVVLGLGIGFTTAAIALGLYISASSSWWVFLAGLGCIGVAVLYSAGPMPLSYTPFGELAAGTTMGPGMMLIAVYAMSGAIPSLAVLVSIPMGLLIGAINFANNLRDREQDKEGGRRTLAILLGRDRARRLLAGIFAAAFAWVLMLVLLRRLTPWGLLALLSAPLAVRVIRRFAQYSEAKDLHPAVKGTSQLLLAFGVLLQAGLLLALSMS